MYDVCIKDGTVINAEGSFKGDIYISEGKIAALVKKGGQEYEAKEVIDAEGYLVMPGFVDPHSHLNDPGLTESEDFYTGTCSAAAGGITTVMEHPLTFPLPSNYKNLWDKKEIVSKKAVTDFALFGACAADNYADIEEMIEMGAVAFKAFLTSSPEMPKLTDSEVIRHMENLKGAGPVMPIHCENEMIVEGFTERRRMEGKVHPTDYDDARPEISEIEAINRMCLFARYTGGKIHIVHCSVPEGVDAVNSYKEKGADVTVETCPHFLLLDSTDVEKWGVYAICNPPIRKRSTVEKMWERVLKGKIDFIGSDHATYTFEEKEEGMEDVYNTPAGLSGIQTCFTSFFSEGVGKRKMSLESFVAMSSTNAAKRYGLYPQKGAVRIGSDGDVVILDPNKSWRVEEGKLFYKKKWTPYMGMEINCQVKRTIVRGVTVYKDGEICVEAGFGKYVPMKKGK